MYYNPFCMTWLWGIAAAAALLWPDRAAGPFDGVPLDRVAEAIAVGVIFPALWWFHPRFLNGRAARTLILLLVGWKAFSTAALAQEGLCVQFLLSRPYFADALGAPHSWDLRADWRAPMPRCSAIMTRSYHDLAEFPAWFFNLAPDNESWPIAEDRPPGARVAISIRGFVHAREAGVLTVDTARDVAATLVIDGQTVSGPATLQAGTHAFLLDGVLTGERWAIVPRWNGDELWTHVTTTNRRPTTIDLSLRPWSRWIPTLLVAGLLVMWTGSALARIRSAVVLGWTVAASGAVCALVLSDRADLARWMVGGLIAAALLPVPRRLHNHRAAFLLVGVPWLTYAATCASTAIGRFVLYGAGHDTWMYQRFAYRIVLQGYWLEGGAKTFYFQGGYRWIVGLLHAIFGDSSAGEWLWDGACLLAGSLFAFRVTRAFAGFRWAIAAAALPLTIFILGTPFYLIGYGLSEISSAGLIHMGALLTMHSRRGRTPAAVGGAALAFVAFLARLNNLITASGIATFALPLRLPARAFWHPAMWFWRVRWRTVAAVAATIAVGLGGFAWRTWYYTGVFSIFHGTQRNVVALWSMAPTFAAGIGETIYSVMMVLTVNDPPRFDPVALPVLIGALCAVLAVAGVPCVRNIPLVLPLFFFAAIASAFIARGWYYPGRFSMHVLPVTSALFICAAAALVRPRHTSAA